MSRTVYDNFVNALSPEAKSRLTHLEPYPFTYLEPSKNFEPHELSRQNIIMYGHRCIASKNPILFAEVVKEMHRDGQLNGWQVRFCGRGPMAGALRSMLTSERENGVVDIAYSRDFPNELLSTKIFVSIIETGNYPSQSVLEAMQAGNLLLLSDTGETRKKFFHENICFPLLQKDAIKSGLLTLMAVAQGRQFQQTSLSMRTFYQEMADRDEYTQSLLRIYNAPSHI